MTKFRVLMAFLTFFLLSGFLPTVSGCSKYHYEYEYKIPAGDGSIMDVKVYRTSELSHGEGAVIYEGSRSVYYPSIYIYIDGKVVTDVDQYHEFFDQIYIPGGRAVSLLGGVSTFLPIGSPTNSIRPKS